MQTHRDARTHTHRHTCKRLGALLTGVSVNIKFENLMLTPDEKIETAVREINH